MPRPKAKQPWLAAGISRSTWYRRQKKAREQAAAAQPTTMRQAALDRLEWQITQLRGELETATRYMDEGAAILGELAAMTKTASFLERLNVMGLIRLLRFTKAATKKGDRVRPFAPALECA